MAMVKKIYMKPEIELDRMEPEQFLALSLNGTTDNEEDLLGREFDYEDEGEE